MLVILLSIARETNRVLLHINIINDQTWNFIALQNCCAYNKESIA